MKDDAQLIEAYLDQTLSEDERVLFENRMKNDRELFTEVKIDRTLISNIESDLFSQVIVGSLVNIAIQDDLKIVAEGIERVEELEYLDRFKEHIVMQGFLISRPKGKTEFIRWAQSWLHMVSLNSNSRR